MAHSCVENFLHVIFATKNRLELIPSKLEGDLYAYIGGIAKNRNSTTLKINGTEDHLHLLIKLHPDMALSVLIKELKSYSSGWMKKQGCHTFSWQEGYGAFSCSTTHIKKLSAYIENQKKHHCAHTFEAELERLNRIWGTSWIYPKKAEIEIEE